MNRNVTENELINIYEDYIRINVKPDDEREQIKMINYNPRQTHTYSVIDSSFVLLNTIIFRLTTK